MFRVNQQSKLSDVANAVSVAIVIARVLIQLYHFINDLPQNRADRIAAEQDALIRITSDLGGHAAPPQAAPLYTANNPNQRP